MTNLETNCVPSGICSQNLDSTNAYTYSCYAGGITREDYEDMSGDAHIVVKNSSSTCYEITYNWNDIASDVQTAAIVSNDISEVAMMNMVVASDGVTQIWSVTCTASQPVPIDPSCVNAWPLYWMESYGSVPDCSGAAICTW
jgi:hypothetical protein